MPFIPQKLPERGPKWFVQIATTINRIIEHLYSLQPLQTINSEVEHTTSGVFIRPKGSGGTTARALQFKGQWIDTAYDKDDIVIRKTANELNGIGTASDAQSGRYNVAGTWIANRQIVKGDKAPGEETNISEANRAWGEFSLGQWDRLVLSNAYDAPHPTEANQTIEKSNAIIISVKELPDFDAWIKVQGVNGNYCFIRAVDLMGQNARFLETAVCDPLTGRSRYCRVLRSEFYDAPLGDAFEQNPS